jgi:Arc/MetJ-type ribon-helix-helix transcriptional regulator
MNKKWLWLLLFLWIQTGCNEPETVDAQSQVNVFLIDINPKLYQAMSQMRDELTLVDQKIQKLYDLKDRFPNQRDMVNKALKQWQGLRKDLDSTLKRIRHQAERAYVAYELDEIQGKQKFSAVSQELLKEANVVLANAETTKLLIEEELYGK